MNQQPETRGSNGIGGWLIIPVIGLFFSVYHGLSLYLAGELLLLQSGMWAALSTPGTIFYKSHWAPFVVSLAFLQTIVVVLSISALVAMFRKKSFVPALMVCVYVVGVLMMANDYLVAEFLFPQIDPAWAAELQSASLKKLIGVSLAASIWIPYFVRSRRVKNTFVR